MVYALVIRIQISSNRMFEHLFANICNQSDASSQLSRSEHFVTESKDMNALHRHLKRIESKKMRSKDDVIPRNNKRDA